MKVNEEHEGGTARKGKTIRNNHSRLRAMEITD